MQLSMCVRSHIGTPKYRTSCLLPAQSPEWLADGPLAMNCPISSKKCLVWEAIGGHLVRLLTRGCPSSTTRGLARHQHSLRNTHHQGDCLTHGLTRHRPGTPQYQHYTSLQVAVNKPGERWVLTRGLFSA